MTYNVYRNTPEWKPAKVPALRPSAVCPRCHNTVQYSLVWDGDGFGFPGLLTFKYNKHYAFKCPICPNFEPVSPAVAEALLKG